MKYALLFGLCLIVSTSARALQPGDKVPDMALPSTTGAEIRLTDFAGSWVVLYFYPRAFTAGCTAQACSLRDDYGALQQRGAVILGASLDDTERIKAFKKEYALPFELLSDSNAALSGAFDSLTADRQRAARKTFIIDPQGVIAYRFDRAKTDGHADEVLEKLDELMAN